jgi:fructokinase
MADVVCLGEALIDFVALESGVSVSEASGFVKAPGGAPLNVAAGVAKLGVSSAFLSKVGDDPFGHYIEQTLASVGVDTSGLIFDEDYRTGLAFVSLKEDGDRDFCFFRHPSADMLYDHDDLNISVMEGGKAFQFGSITLIDEPVRSATENAAQRARDHGLLVSYDPNLRPPLWQDLTTAQIGLRSGIAFADIIKVSEEELAFLMSRKAVLPETPPEPAEIVRLAEAFCREYPHIQLLAVTRGAKGCYWRTRSGNTGSLQAEKVTAVDTTGAGDGFVAGMLTQFLALPRFDPKHLPDDAATLNSVFHFAGLVGTLTTLKKGAVPAMPTVNEIAAFQAKHPFVGYSPSPDF